MQRKQPIRIVDTIEGITIISEPTRSFDAYIRLISQKVNIIFLVYNNTTHLVSSNLKVSLDFAHKLAWSSAADITIKLFDKSDIDEVMVLASKIHNVDLIPIQVMKN